MIRGWERDMQGLSLELPTGYYLERDPVLLILRSLDGEMIGAFSARGLALDALQQTLQQTLEEKLEEKLEESLRREAPADQGVASSSLPLHFSSSSPLRAR